MTDSAWILDFDNHYYESEDAFTRHQDERLRNRGVRWADVDGRRRLLVGGYFAQHPSETFGEHVWVTPFWEDDVLQIAEEFRVDRLLLGSDWPHAEGTREPYGFVTATLAGLPDGAVRQISRDNASRLLGLAVP